MRKGLSILLMTDESIGTMVHAVVRMTQETHGETADKWLLRPSRGHPLITEHGHKAGGKRAGGKE